MSLSLNLMYQNKNVNFFYDLLGTSKKILKIGVTILAIAFIIYCILEVCLTKPKTPKKRFKKLLINTNDTFLESNKGPPSCPGGWINPVLFNQDNTVKKRIWGNRFIDDFGKED
ncbi:MAG: hypothetical protein EB053_03010 [Chlamydiae bacterium]|nr:hypothetical protein [Chlamydiota bacterium]